MRIRKVREFVEILNPVNTNQDKSSQDEVIELLRLIKPKLVLGPQRIFYRLKKHGFVMLEPKKGPMICTLDDELFLLNGLEYSKAEINNIFLDKGLEHVFRISEISLLNLDSVLLENAENLYRSKQISISISNIKDIIEKEKLNLLKKIFEKLLKKYIVAHIHANNLGGVVSINYVQVPNILNILFVQKDLYTYKENDELHFPTKIDLPNDQSLPDIYLAKFDY